DIFLSIPARRSSRSRRGASSMRRAQQSLAGDRMAAYLTLSPSVFLLLLLTGVPMVTVIFTSLQRVGMGETSGPFVGLKNFAWVFSSDAFYSSLGHTFVWVFGSVALEMLLGLGLALLLNKKFRFRGIARAVIMAPYLIPSVVAVLVWR